LQFKPTDQVLVNVTGLLSEFDANNVNENYLAWITRALGNGGTLSNTTVQNGTAVAGRVASLNNGTQDFGVVYDAIDRFARATTRNVDFDAIYRPTDDWITHLKFGIASRGSGESIDRVEPRLAMSISTQSTDRRTTGLRRNRH